MNFIQNKFISFAQSSIKRSTMIAPKHRIIWLDQKHTSIVLDTDELKIKKEKNNDNSLKIADAIISTQKHTVCAVLTADCVPILITNKAGTIVAAIHAGWRGMSANIIPNTIKLMKEKINIFSTKKMSNKFYAYIGPAISRDHFLVGKEVHQVFMDYAEHLAGNFSSSQTSKNTILNLINQAFFSSLKKNYFYCDLISIAKITLEILGIKEIYGGEICTFKTPELHSYRRDGNKGRIASLIWLN